MTAAGAPRLDPPDRDPAPFLGVGEVVRLAVPTVLNTVSVTVMQFVDGWMVSRVGKEALSAQFIGGISIFVVLLFFLGLLTAVATYASQSLGAGRPDRAVLYGWQGVWLACGAGVLVAGLVLPAPRILALFGHAPEVHRLQTRYFQILAAGAPLVLVARGLGSWFVGIHRPSVTLVAGVAANAVNVLANWVLIFGHWGMPALGLVGAALGTLLGFAVEAALMLTAFLVGGAGDRFPVRAQVRFSWPALKDLLRLGTPAGAVVSGEVLMWTIFMGGVVGGFGTAALAAGAILDRYWHLCFLPAIGVGRAVQAIVGRHCGAGRPDLAMRRAHAGLALVEVYMVGMGVLIWLNRGPLVAFFNEAGDPEVQAIAERCVVFLLVCQAFDAMSITFVNALRGAGDTFWPGLVQLTLAYVIGLGGSVLVARLRPEWGPMGPWAAASGYVVLLGCLMWARFAGGRWRTRHLVAAVVPPVPAIDKPTDVAPP